MEANEAQELQENAEHAEHSSSLKPVAFTMSLLAVLVAVTSVVGHRTHTEAVLKQAEASDTWNEYQAKKNRAYDTAMMTNLLNVVTLKDADAAKKIAAGYADHQAKWEEDLKEEQTEARGLEEKVRLAERRADYFDLSEALLEIGLVISSVTLLTRSRIYWYLGIASSIVGIISVVLGLMLKS